MKKLITTFIVLVMIFSTTCRSYAVDQAEIQESVRESIHSFNQEMNGDFELLINCIEENLLSIIDYKLDETYQKSGCNIEIWIRDEEFNKIYIHLDTHGNYLWTMVVYSDGNTEMLYE